MRADKTLPDAVQRRPLLALFLRYKERVAFLALIAGLLMIGREVSSAYPRDVDIVFELGPAHGQVDEVRISYLHQGETVGGVVFRRIEERIDDTIGLSPGRYTVHAEIESATGVEEIDRTLEVPAEGRVHIRLYEGDIS